VVKSFLVLISEFFRLTWLVLFTFPSSLFKWSDIGKNIQQPLWPGKQKFHVKKGSINFMLFQGNLNQLKIV